MCLEISERNVFRVFILFYYFYKFHTLYTSLSTCIFFAGFHVSRNGHFGNSSLEYSRFLQYSLFKTAIGAAYFIYIYLQFTTDPDFKKK